MYCNVSKYYPCWSFIISLFKQIIICGFRYSELFSRGSVQDVLRDKSLKKQLNWDRRLGFAIDSCIGMVYLHHLNIIHRDMKCGNLFVDRNWRVAVGDFGLSVTTREFHGSGPIGTVGYIAPELIQGNEASFASDVFSYGMTLWEIFTAEILHDHLPEDEFSINASIVSGER